MNTWQLPEDNAARRLFMQRELVRLCSDAFVPASVMLFFLVDRKSVLKLRQMRTLRVRRP